MKLQHIFTNFIGVEFLDIDNDKLAVFCKRKYQEQQIINPKVSCYIDFSEPEMQEVATAIDKNLQDVHKQLGFRRDARQEVIRSWINVGMNGYIERPHNHPGSFFVGVYYVKANSGAGKLNFLSPNASSVTTILPPMIEYPNAFNGAEIAHEPVSGKLLIFPSWLMHYVEPSPEERISIAFNASMILPEGALKYYTSNKTM